MLRIFLLVHLSKNPSYYKHLVNIIINSQQRINNTNIEKQKSQTVAIVPVLYVISKANGIITTNAARINKTIFFAAHKKSSNVILSPTNSLHMSCLLYHKSYVALDRQNAMCCTYDYIQPHLHKEGKPKYI